ncbi:hypothetical protein ACHAW5_008050 [Stephanodiscus triporus]|uniref:Mitochondrial carrier protein n=1 Tax=Stephanodiscus triporus TaxID=2934178 RepID=A0ABD3PZY2_9STRA
MSSSSAAAAGVEGGAAAVEDLEWEEWDPATSPLSFAHHCLAGSFAGVMEHTLLYPLDTVKTCWQSQVLSRATGGGGGGGGCGIFPGGGSTTAATAATVATADHHHHHRGIWSTMKHLMHQGRHHHHHHRIRPPPSSQQQVHALAAGGAMAAPNVVDLTDPATTAAIRGGPSSSCASSSSTSSRAAASPPPPGGRAGGGGRQLQQRRPWSAEGRATRGATIGDIVAHGTIRSSYSGEASAAAATTSAAAAAPGTTTTTTGAGVRRLFRGVQTMFLGCVPAHALYFSSYEIVKGMCTDGGGGGGDVGGSRRHEHHHRHRRGSGGGDDDYDYDDEEEEEQEDGEGRRRRRRCTRWKEEDYFGDDDGGHVGHDTLSPAQAMLAGTVATLLHDFVMTPMDTMKQRLQLGHYDNLRHSFVSIVRGDAAAGVPGEGWRGLYRSFPVTVMTNVPYGMIMMTTNEWLRGAIEDGLYGRRRHDGEGGGGGGGFHFATILLSGMGAGTAASALTAPLDRVKTRLQTQRMGMALPSSTYRANNGNGNVGGPHSTMAILEERALAAAQGRPKVCPKMAVAYARRTLFPNSPASPLSAGVVGVGDVPPSVAFPSSSSTTPFKTYYSTPLEAFNSILAEEGPRGLFRGTLPRVALHAPSVAISWTAYEMAKDWLLWSQ